MKPIRVIGFTIQKYAEQCNLSAADLAEIIGVSETHMKRAMHGLAFCTYPQLQKLAEVFQVDISQLIPGDEEYYNNNVIAHSYGDFTDMDAREMILDIAYDYIDVLEEVKRLQEEDK